MGLVPVAIRFYGDCRYDYKLVVAETGSFVIIAIPHGTKRRITTEIECYGLLVVCTGGIAPL
jgi:hypothetical protein